MTRGSAEAQRQRDGVVLTSVNAIAIVRGVSADVLHGATRFDAPLAPGERITTDVVDAPAR